VTFHFSLVTCCWSVLTTVPLLVCPAIYHHRGRVWASRMFGVSHIRREARPRVVLAVRHIIAPPWCATILALDPTRRTAGIAPAKRSAVVGRIRTKLGRDAAAVLAAGVTRAAKACCGEEEDILACSRRTGRGWLVREHAKELLLEEKWRIESWCRSQNDTRVPSPCVYSTVRRHLSRIHIPAPIITLQHRPPPRRKARCCCY
jgi:hypothetical protein